MQQNETLSSIHISFFQSTLISITYNQPWFGVSETCGTATNSGICSTAPTISVIVSFLARQVLECSHVASTQTLTMRILRSLFALEPISHGNLKLLGKKG